MNLIVLKDENFDQIIAEHELVVVDFWAEWCAPCLAFNTIYEQVAAQNPEVIFGKVNIEEQGQLTADFHIRSIPTIMIIRRKISLFSESGALSSHALQDLIDQAKALDIEQICKDLQQE